MLLRRVRKLYTRPSWTFPCWSSTTACSFSSSSGVLPDRMLLRPLVYETHSYVRRFRA